LLCDVTSSGNDGGSTLRHPQFVSGEGGTGDDEKNGDNNDACVLLIAGPALTAAAAEKIVRLTVPGCFT